MPNGLPQKIVTPTVPLPRRRATAFTPLQRIIQANIGAGGRLGEAVGGDIAREAAVVRSGVQESQRQFQEKLKPEQTELEAKRKTFGERLKQIESGLTAEEAGKFEKAPEYTYRGLQELPGLEAIKGRVGELEELGVEAGRLGKFGLLRRAVGGPRYARGKQELDVLLFGGGAGTGELRRKATGLGRELIRPQEELARSQAAELRRQAETFGAEKAKELTRRIGEIRTPLEKRYDIAATNYRNALEYLKKRFQEVGVSPEKYAEKYLTAPTFSSVATAPEYAQMLALARLSGQELTGFKPEEFGTYRPEEIEQQRIEDIIRNVTPIVMKEKPTYLTPKIKEEYSGIRTI